MEDYRTISESKMHFQGLALLIQTGTVSYCRYLCLKKKKQKKKKLYISFFDSKNYHQVDKHFSQLLFLHSNSLFFIYRVLNHSFYLPSTQYEREI